MWAWVSCQPRGLSCTAVGPFPEFWSLGLLPAQPDEAPAPEGNEWSCAATAHYISAVLGKQVAVPQGKRKHQVGRLVSCLCQLREVVRSGSCVAPHKSTQFLWAHLPHLDLCILEWLFLSPQTCWEDAGRVRWSMLCSCQALPEVLPVLCPRVLPHCPAVRGRAGTWTPPVAQPLPPIPHPRKGKSL